MKKRFNIYSMGNLIIKEDSLLRFKKSLIRSGILREINRLRADEMFIHRDPVSGRQWEYERVF